MDGSIGNLSSLGIKYYSLGARSIVAAAAEGLATGFDKKAVLSAAARS